jgi:alpha-glucosidase (family GH31 glycosyl hydrolase)
MFNSQDEIPLEVTARGTIPPDDILPDPRVEPICKKLLHARYELLPYIYNLSREVLSGVPILRPMWFKYPKDQQAIGLGDQYMFGDSLLVAPVTDKGAESRSVYFPEGDFYCYWTGEKIAGGNRVDVEAKLDRIPVYVPAGGIIAKAPLVMYVDTDKKDDFDPVTIEVYTGKDGAYTLYEDDGVSMGYTRNENTTTKFTWDDAKQELTAEGKSTIFPGKQREIKVKLVPEGKEYSLTVNY